MLKLIIFDMDGLMFATEQVNCRAFMEVVKEEGYHPTFEQFTSFLGMNARDIQKKYYDYYGEDTDAEGIYKKVGSRAKQIIKEEGVPEKNGLRELLNAVIFLEICQKFDVKPEETLVLEDSSNGVQAALAGNLPVINVPDLLPIPEEQQEKCVAVVSDLVQVIPLLDLKK